MAVLGARRAPKIVNRCHFNRFPRDFLVHVRPAQHHMPRVTQEDGTGERPRRPATVDGRLTGTRGTVSLLAGIFGMREIVATRVISGVFATYEGNTKLSSPQTTHSLSRRHPTARTRQPVPRTEAAPTERTRHASEYGCSRAAQWLLYHRLPDPQLSPVAITPTIGWRIRTLCRKARWPPRSNERVSSV